MSAENSDQEYDYDDVIDDIQGADEKTEDDEDGDADVQDDAMGDDEEDDDGSNRVTRLLHKHEIHVVPNEKRITSHYVTQFELAGILSKRTEQISKYNNYLGSDNTLTDPYHMAICELKEGKLPIKLSRCIETYEDGDVLHSVVEYWELSEMVINFSDV